MIGGLFKSSSRVAMVAAAGLLSGGVAAQAADLGGNCCADLEERVAELEATTARKGNRRVSLTITGTVANNVVWWDDGHETNTYVGVDDNRTSRFRFQGNASINAEYTAGFRISVRTGGAAVTGGGAIDQSGVPAGDTTPFVENSFVFIRSRTWGEISLGAQSDATDGIRSICLGCTADVSASSVGTQMAGIHTKIGNTYGPTWGDLETGGVADGGRGQLVRYSTPSIAGFQASASWGGDDNYDVALRYANEFGQFRVAGGIGYSHDTGNGNSAVGTQARESEFISGSISMAHVPTGLYVAFAAAERTNGLQSSFNANGGAPQQDDTDTQWWVGAGIVTKLNSLGNTTFSVGYGQSDEGTDLCANCTAHGLPASGVAVWQNAETESFAIGVQQAIDAAAMTIQISYGHLSGDITNQATGQTLSIDDAQYVQAGMRINF